MNSRPIVLIFLLLVLIITSQFEWKQQIGEAEANPTATRRRQQALEREDAVKEKVSTCSFIQFFLTFTWVWAFPVSRLETSCHFSSTSPIIYPQHLLH
jgi:hypothetical protein